MNLMTNQSYYTIILAIFVLWFALGICEGAVYVFRWLRLRWRKWRERRNHAMATRLDFLTRVEDGK